MIIYRPDIKNKKTPYSGVPEYKLVIDKLASMHIPDDCPIKTRIILDIGKQWATACKDGMIAQNEQSFIEEWHQYQVKLTEVVAIDFDEYKKIDFYIKNFSGR